MAVAFEIGQTVLALLLAPGVVGLVRWMKARLQNRRGAPCWQPYLELRKLFAKEVVVSRNASWSSLNTVRRTAPPPGYVCLSACSDCTVPVSSQRRPESDVRNARHSPAPAARVGAYAPMPASASRYAVIGS